MSVKALLLYGSRARRESQSKSDIDLLAVTAMPVKLKTVTQNDVTISICHQAEIIRHAQGGDLFVLHIVTEAKVLFDWNSVLPSIQAAFRYKDDYSREIRLASDSAGSWFATLASSRTPRGSTAELHGAPARSLSPKPQIIGSPSSQHNGSRSLRVRRMWTILESKAKRAIESQTIESLERLLLNFGTAEPPFAATLEEQERIFKGDRNRLGLIALKRLSG